MNKIKQMFQKSLPESKMKYEIPPATLRKETKEDADSNNEEYEILEREIVPANIICPDCGGVTLEGLEYCDKCGGEIL